MADQLRDTERVCKGSDKRIAASRVDNPRDSIPMCICPVCSQAVGALRHEERAGKWPFDIRVRWTVAWHTYTLVRKIDVDGHPPF